MNNNGIFSQRDDTDYSASTAKRLSCEKVLLIVCAGIAAFCDFVTFVVACVAQYAPAFIMFPLFLLAVDGLFIAGICFTNFRFRYSLAVWIGYLILSFTFTVIMLAGAAGSSGIQNFTTAAIALAVLSHIVLWLTIGICALAGNFFPRKNYVKVILCAVTGIAVLFTFAYSVFVADKGFYGQDEDNLVRAVSYTEDESLDGYQAHALLMGCGTKVVIPETFNGKKVVSVSADILVDDSIDNIVIEGEEMLEIRDFESDMQIPSTLSIGVSKNTIDEYREKYIGLALDNTLALASAFYPADLADDERYVTFAYDWAASDEVLNHVLPTWIGKKGDVLDISSYAEANGITYIVNGDMRDSEDLHWNMLNNGGYVFKDVNAGGENVDGKKIDDSLYRAKVNFDKIYKVTVLDDNDSEYEPDASFKTTGIGDEVLDYRYVAYSVADELLQEIAREGFSLAWEEELRGERSRFTSLKDLLDSDAAYIYNNNVSIAPVWTLNAPQIVRTYTDRADNKFVYGDDVNFGVDALAPFEGCTLSYVWRGADGKPLGYYTQQALVTCITPALAGTYQVTVKASSDQTSLISETQGSVTLAVDKKTLRFIWSFPENAVYDGSERAATCEIVAEDVVGDDYLTFTVDTAPVVNAGTYTDKVTLLQGDNAGYYGFDSSAQFTYSVAKRPVSLSWQNTQFIYNGGYQYPKVDSVSNAVIGEEDEVIASVIYGKYGRNAGTFEVTASFASDSNYTISEGAVKSYSISKKEVVAVWQYTDKFVYNGYGQYPVIEDIEGLTDADRAGVIAGVIYSGYGKNAGEYTVGLSLGSGSENYLLVGDTEKTYTISKKSLTVGAVAADKVYDGKAGGNFTIRVQGLVGKDTAASLGAPVFSGDAVSAVNAGSYTLSVSFEPNDVNANYDIVYTSDTFVISPKSVAAVWSGTRVFAEDGEQHAPYIVTDGREYQGQAEITYEYFTSDGEPVAKPSEAGKYYVTASVKSDNYVLTGLRCDFEIVVEEAEK